MSAARGVWNARLAMMGVVLCWSGTFTFIKIALDHLTPFDITLLRFLIAAVPLVALALWKGWPRLSREEWSPFALVSLVTVTVYHFSLNWGETRVSAGVAALIVGTGPIWTVVFSALHGTERVTPVKVSGIVLALVGVALIVLGAGDDLSIGYGVGALVLLMAPVSWSYSTVLAKPLVMRHGAEKITASTTLVGTATVLPVLATGTLERAGSLPGEVLGALLFLALGATVWGYFGFNYALRRLAPSETMVFIYLNPVMGLAWSFLILQEVPTALTLLGGSVVIAGVVLASRRRAPARESSGEGAAVDGAPLRARR